MKTTLSILRVIAFMIVSFFLLEYLMDSGDQWAINKYPIVWAVLGALLLFSIAFEIIAFAFERVLHKGLSPEAKEQFAKAEIAKHEKRFGWFKEMFSNKASENEPEIVLDHNYDGIRELDNNLPPWWVYLFYASIIFAVVYLLRYHVFDGINQTQEYEIEVAQAKIAVEEYKKNNKDLVDVNTVEMLTDASDLAAGKEIYTVNCVACHKDDGGGGIGPNLTDDYWILGGGIKEVFHTISEGGRPGKGMIAWKTDLKPLEIAQVSSYVLTLQGITPVDPKEPEGELWQGDDASAESTNAETAESAQTEGPEA
ncbi:MAG TPA: cbb3-type cytochrome c oxidase N-terminal domain-containing protein [Aequorivita sp.]|nr:cbb3-type cytochrome c oxidase N-terminal domain-containing protein [Aequorivita sp.]